MNTASTTLDREVRARLGETPFSAAVMVDGTLLAGLHTPPNPELPVYSLTKTYIAAMVLRSVAEGCLSLETSLARFFPDVPDAAAITLEHLLSHTSGLPDYGALPEYRRAVASGTPPWSFDVFAERTYRHHMLFPPGTAWAYSNPGYALLVHVLERTWACPVAELLQALIARPLALDHTRFVETLDDERICPSWSASLSESGLLQPVKTHYHPGWVWHRLMVSNATDSAAFLDAVLRRRWLGEELTTAMMRLRPVGGLHPPWTSPAYGLGLMGESDGVHGPVYGHNGGGPGYATSAYYFARSGCAAAVVAATEDGDAVLEAVFALVRTATS